MFPPFLNCLNSRHNGYIAVDQTNLVDRDHSEPLSTFNGLKKGDCISFERNGCFRYKHHGVVYKVIDDTKIDVIHLTGDSNDLISSSIGRSQASICKTVVDIGDNETIVKYTYRESRADGINPGDVANVIRENRLPDSYNLFHFNCESFANYCAIGRVVSKQTRQTNTEIENRLNEMVKEKKDTIK